MPNIQQSLESRFDTWRTMQTKQFYAFDVLKTVDVTFESRFSINKSVSNNWAYEFDIYNGLYQNLSNLFETYKEILPVNLDAEWETYKTINPSNIGIGWKIIPGVRNDLTLLFKASIYVQNSIYFYYIIEAGNVVAQKLVVPFTSYGGSSRSLIAPFGCYSRMAVHSLTLLYDVHAGAKNSLVISYGMTPSRTDLGHDHIPMIPTNRIYIV